MIFEAWTHLQLWYNGETMYKNKFAQRWITKRMFRLENAFSCKNTDIYLKTCRVLLGKRVDAATVTWNEFGSKGRSNPIFLTPACSLSLLSRKCYLRYTIVQKATCQFEYVSTSDQKCICHFEDPQDALLHRSLCSNGFLAHLSIRSGPCFVFDSSYCSSSRSGHIWDQNKL